MRIHLREFDREVVTYGLCTLLEGIQFGSGRETEVGLSFFQTTSFSVLVQLTKMKF